MKIYNSSNANVTKYKTIEIKALVKKALSKKKVMFRIKSGTNQLESLVGKFDKNMIYKFISVKGGFSSINFVDYILKNEVINELTICSLAIGQKHIKYLNKLHKDGRIDKAEFIVGDIFEKRGLSEKYTYYDYFKKVCKENNWKYKCTNNHAKIILMKTSENYYVVETSGNFNENPKIEQFSFEENEDLYNFYKGFISEVLNND